MENSSSSSVSTNSDHHYPYLNNLPDLVYYHVLKNLDLDDLWMCRLISKRFYSIIKNYHISDLSFLEDPCYSRFGNWLTKTKPPRPKYELPLSKLNLLRHPSNNLLNLKYLRIEDTFEHHRLRLDDLNKFTKLQILEITPISLDSNDLLQLPDLKALSIGISEDNLEEVVSVVIDTPNLHSLAIINDFKYDLIDNQFKFKHPLSIKYLRLEDCDKNAPIFTNLECLEIHGALYRLESSDLLMFNNLKTLRISGWYYHNKARDLFRSKKDDLEFVIRGVRIKEINKIGECCRLRQVG